MCPNTPSSHRDQSNGSSVGRYYGADSCCCPFDVFSYARHRRHLVRSPVHRAKRHSPQVDKAICAVRWRVWSGRRGTPGRSRDALSTVSGGQLSDSLCQCYRVPREHHVRMVCTPSGSSAATPGPNPWAGPYRRLGQRVGYVLWLLEGLPSGVWDRKERVLHRGRLPADNFVCEREKQTARTVLISSGVQQRCWSNEGKAAGTSRLTASLPECQERSPKTSWRGGDSSKSLAHRVVHIVHLGVLSVPQLSCSKISRKRLHKMVEQRKNVVFFYQTLKLFEWW